MEQLKNIIEQYSLNEFKSFININKVILSKIDFNILMYSCKYGKFEIAEFIISKTNKWINDVDDENNTILMYAFHQNKFDFAIMLLDYGFTNFNQRNNQGMLALNYINDTNKITHEILSRLLAFKTIDNEEYKFRIYSDNEIKPKNVGLGGTYGDIYYDTNSGNMVKKAKDKYTSISLIREILICRLINSVNPNITSILKGININNEKLSLVFESLHYSLDDVFTFYRDIDIEIKKNYFKSIYFNLLQNIDKINTMGIIHRDLKPSNVMIDRNGYVKIIDFGLAEYAGIKKSNIKFLGTDNYIPPDSNTAENIRIGIELLKLPNKKRNYSSDIFSYGVIIIKSLLGDSFSLLFIDEKIYKYKIINGNNKINANLLTKFEMEILTNFSPNLIDMLKSIFNIDSNSRKTAKELLMHKFFSDFEHVEIECNLHCKDEDNIATIEKQLFSDDDIRFERGLLRYGEEIFNFVKDQTIPITNIDDDDFEIFKSCWDCYDFVSTFPKDFDLEFNRNIYCTSINLNFNYEIFDIYFNHNYIDYNSTLEKTLRNIGEVYPISITSLIEFYVVKLQQLNVISSNIHYFRSVSYKKFYEISLNLRKEPLLVNKILREIINDISEDKMILMPLFDN